MRERGERRGVVSGFWVKEPWLLFSTSCSSSSFFLSFFISQLSPNLLLLTDPWAIISCSLPHLPGLQFSFYFSILSSPFIHNSWINCKIFTFCSFVSKKTTSPKHNCLHFLQGFASTTPKTPALLTRQFHYVYFPAAHPRKLTRKQHGRSH